MRKGRPSVKGKIKRFLKEADKPYTLSEISRELELGLSTISKWVNRWKEEGKVKIKERGGLKLTEWKKKEVKAKG